MTTKFLSRSQLCGSDIHQESDHMEQEEHWREKGKESSNSGHKRCPKAAICLYLDLSRKVPA